MRDGLRSLKTAYVFVHNPHYLNDRSLRTTTAVSSLSRNILIYIRRILDSRLKFCKLTGNGDSKITSRTDTAQKTQRSRYAA